MLILRVSADSRTLKKAIMALLKSGIAQRVDKVNYMQSYIMDSTTKTMTKTSTKLILITYEVAKNDQLLRLIDKVSSSLGEWTILNSHHL